MGSLVLSVEAHTTAGLHFIPRTSRPGIPAASGSWPVIPASRTTGHYSRRFKDGDKIGRLAFLDEHHANSRESLQLLAWCREPGNREGE
jgi:hypothetical protein